MEDTIEVCSKCGKMPRAIDLVNGFFRCTRCSNNQLMAVSGDDYEKVVTELDARYQERVAQKRLEIVEKEMPIEPPKPTRKKAASKKKATKKKTAKKKPKAAKKKTVKKKAKSTKKKKKR